MRTTLEIDADVLDAAKELGARQKKTAGKTISESARRGIQNYGGKQSQTITNGFEVLPADGLVVTVQTVQKMSEESVEA